MSEWLDELRGAITHTALRTNTGDSKAQLALAAARAVLDGREVWWCEEHGAEKYPGRGERCRVAEWAENEPGPCRMKQVRIIDMEEGQ